MVAGPLPVRYWRTWGLTCPRGESSTGESPRHLGVAKDGINLLWPVGIGTSVSVTLDLRALRRPDLAREL